ncbi:MAG TPA: aldehyde dehydrogenase family protein, partial [Blastocatellia bacterium]|nr:aldehyde dehydrogenase family protein [Blastocatellia bacterium]
MSVHEKLYVNGGWVEPAGKGMLDVINSTTEEVMGRVPEGAAEDIKRAVAAARRAFDSWSGTPADKRAGFLQKI